MTFSLQLYFYGLQLMTNLVMKSFVLFTELGYPKLQCLKKKYRNYEVKECVASMEREVLIISQPPTVAYLGCITFSLHKKDRVSKLGDLLRM